MYKIQTITAGSAVASLDFTVPSGYDDLYLVVQARTNRATQVDDQLKLQFNGSTTGYSERGLAGNGSSAFSFTGAVSSSIPDALWATASGATASTFGNSAAYIPNYLSSNAKSVSTDSVTENNGTSASQAIIAGLWTGTDPITSIKLSPLNGTTIEQGSTATLYGIRKYNTTATPKATGGIITYADGYWVHTFTASGTFTPTQNLTCEYLVIAGGGGGGGSFGSTSGGGGAGGYRSSVSGESSGRGASAESPLSLTASTNYTVTVGAGGASGTSSNNVTGTNGSNSVFSTITSTGGGGGGAGGYGGANANGAAGGSGGGAGNAGGTGGAGTTAQGYDGGNESPGSRGAGGGGAGSAGANSVSSTQGGAGGSGVQSSITGTAIYRAGGGGGGSDGNSGGTPGGAGGLGGGGNGGSNSTYPSTAGQVATGGGGGGGEQVSAKNGGSGIVIVRYAA